MPRSVSYALHSGMRSTCGQLAASWQNCWGESRFFRQTNGPNPILLKLLQGKDYVEMLQLIIGLHGNPKKTDLVMLDIVEFSLSHCNHVVETYQREGSKVSLRQNSFPSFEKVLTTEPYPT